MAREEPDEEEDGFEDDEGDEEEDRGVKKSKKKAKESKNKKGQKVFAFPRAVSITEMFNIINDKLDVLLSKK